MSFCLSVCLSVFLCPFSENLQKLAKCTHEGIQGESRSQGDSMGVKGSQEESWGVKRSQEESRGVKGSQEELREF